MSNSNVIFRYPRSGRHFVKRILSDCITNGDVVVKYAHTINDVVGKGKIFKRIYIIRHPIYSIISHWEYRELDKVKRHLRQRHGVKIPSAYRKKRGLSEAKFYSFLSDNISRWTNLYETKGVGTKYLLVKYHDLILDTTNAICSILDHLEIDINEETVKKSIKTRKHTQTQGWTTIDKQHKPRVITDCPYYSREKFAPLWLKTNGWMEKNHIYLLPM